MDEKETLKQYLELPKGSPPHDTIQRVFFILRPDELQRMLVNILIQFITTAGKCLDEYLYRNDALACCIRDVIAADGKETRNTAKKNSTETEERDTQSWPHQKICDVHHKTVESLLSQEHETNPQ